MGVRLVRFSLVTIKGTQREHQLEDDMEIEVVQRLYRDLRNLNGVTILWIYIYIL